MVRDKKTIKAREKYYDDENDRARDFRDGSIFEDDAMRFAKEKKADIRRMMEW